MKMRNRLKRNRRTTYVRQPFKLTSFTPQECLNFFRFSETQIQKLVPLLGIPDKVCVRWSTCSGVEAFCIMLRRLCYPNRLCELVKFLHRDESSLSNISNYMIKMLYANHKHRLESIQQDWMDANTFDYFADRCVNAGSWYPNVVGFIDGTSRTVCRPKYNQRQVYSGYRKKHCVKYQSVTFPNGLIGRLDGPYIGRRHNAAVLGLSMLRQELTGLFERPGAPNFALYGDAGYSNSRYVKVGYRNHRTLNDRQKQFNKDMSALRVSVEYGFGRIIQQFAFLDFKQNQKLYLQYLKQKYYVAALLTNCQLCLQQKNQVSNYFDCVVPSIEKYLQ